MENFNKYLLTFCIGGIIGISILGYIKRNEAKEFEQKYSQLVLKSQGLQKEIDKLKKEVNTIVVPDLKEDKVVEYWKGVLK